MIIILWDKKSKMFSYSLHLDRTDQVLVTTTNVDFSSVDPTGINFSFHLHLSSHMMTSSNGNIFCVTGHLCVEFTGHRWIPRTKFSDAEFWCFFDLRLNKRLSKQSRSWWFETPSSSLWRYCNDMIPNENIWFSFEWLSLYGTKRARCFRFFYHILTEQVSY